MTNYNCLKNKIRSLLTRDVSPSCFGASNSLASSSKRVGGGDEAPLVTTAFQRWSSSLFLTSAMMSSMMPSGFLRVFGLEVVVEFDDSWTPDGWCWWSRRCWSPSCRCCPQFDVAMNGGGLESSESWPRVEEASLVTTAFQRWSSALGMNRP